MKARFSSFLFSVFSSPRLTAGILMYSVLLVFLTTLAQTEIGIAAAQRDFIESFAGIFRFGGIPIPFLGGAGVGLLASANLVASALRFMKFGARGLGESITHMSLLLLIVGGALQHFMRVEGTLMLREGVPEAAVYAYSSPSDKVTAPRVIKRLPFSVRLKSFSAKKWEGSDIPKSFESEVWFERGDEKILRSIQMNSPASFGGWTFYQMSYGEGGKVSVLSAVRNPARLLPWISVGAAFFGMLLIFLPRAFGKGRNE